MRKFAVLFIVGVATVILLVFLQQGSSMQNGTPSIESHSAIRLSGEAMATTYDIVYVGASVDSADIQLGIDDLLTAQTMMFSTYDSSATLAKINSSRDIDEAHGVGDDFAHVFTLSQQIYKDSDGTFNPAIGPLTLAWGIASEAGEIPSDSRLKRLLEASDVKHFQISDSRPWTIRKADPEAALDFNGIAKGHAVDKIYEYLFSRGLNQFLVELGGEVRTAGNHPDGRAWQIAIEYPAVSEMRAQAVLSINDVSVATSGNYRSVRFDQGRKIVHTIKPQTGQPEDNDLLSVTVIAKDCATADAYATALMVMGGEKAKIFLSEHPELDVYLMIGEDEKNLEVFATPGLEKRLVATE